jgi:predicted phosphate transport protein (TIGR00153 family)
MRDGSCPFTIRDLFMVRFIPRETKFFELFADIANNVVEGARALSDLLHNYDYEQMPAAVAKIAAIEHRGDEMTHRILIKLNQTFITPFDREDIHLLASSLDDVLDFIFAAGDRLLTYKINQPSPSAKVLAGIILKQAEELGKAVALLDKDDPHLLDHCVEVNRLENEADKVSREAIGRLFDGELDPITLIKLKELLEVLEEASDKAEDVADVLETVVLKGA